MLIDFHTHAFPDKIAQRAISSLSEKGNIKPYGTGTASDLIEKMNQDGVDISVVLSIATKPEQETNVNNFAISLLEDKSFVPFGSVFPGSGTSLYEIGRLNDAGIKGIKLHPEYQWFDILDEKMYATYKECGRLGLIVLLHTGADVAYKPPYHSDPKKLNDLCEMFPDTRFVCAHMGGYDMWDEAARVLKYHENMYVDTSMINTVGVISNDAALKIIEKVGVDHVLFGSDMPWGTVNHSKQKLLSLGLDSNDLHKIFSLNAKEILQI